MRMRRFGPLACSLGLAVVSIAGCSDDKARDAVAVAPSASSSAPPVAPAASPRSPEVQDARDAVAATASAATNARQVVLSVTYKVGDDTVSTSSVAVDSAAGRAWSSIAYLGPPADGPAAGLNMLDVIVADGSAYIGVQRPDGRAPDGWRTPWMRLAPDEFAASAATGLAAEAQDVTTVTGMGLPAGVRWPLALLAQSSDVRSAGPDTLEYPGYDVSASVTRYEGTARIADLARLDPAALGMSPQMRDRLLDRHREAKADTVAITVWVGDEGLPHKLTVHAVDPAAQLPDTDVLVAGWNRPVKTFVPNPAQVFDGP